MIVVTGANGMLGKDIVSLLGKSCRGIDIGDIDITSHESVERSLKLLKPSVVINCAAYTDVDGCETETDRAIEVNVEGVAYLAMVTRELGAKLVQISSDYIFDGEKGVPYLEDDPPNPLSIYGKSKLAGELNAAFNENHIIVRTQWLYGVHGKNFVETILRLAEDKDELNVVTDQIGSPTWTADLAKAVVALLEKDCRGVYHAAASGSCSWNEFAKAILSFAGISKNVRSMTSDKLNRPARRPRCSLLSCDKLARDTGFVMKPWEKALRLYMDLRKDGIRRL